MRGFPMNRRRFFKLMGLSTLAAASGRRAEAALIPPFFSYCVVAIGGLVSELRDGKPVSSRWVATGTGFFFGILVKPDQDMSKREYDVYLVTAKHVLDEWKAQQATAVAKGLLLSEMMVRVNPVDVTSRATDFPISEFKEKEG